MNRDFGEKPRHMRHSLRTRPHSSARCNHCKNIAQSCTTTIETTIMADEDVATRAPESDAQEAHDISGIPGDTKPDQGAASMGVGRLRSTTYDGP